MNGNVNKAQLAIKELDDLDLDEDGLYKVLGARLQKISYDASGSDQFALDVPLPEAAGLSDALRTFGKNFFAGVEKQTFDLICGSEPNNQKERDEISGAFHIDKSDVAATLAAVIVAQLGLMPAIAVVVAKLVIKLFYQPTLDATCNTWRPRVYPDSGGSAATTHV